MEETPASSAGVATEEGAAAEVCGASMAANVADEPASGAPPPAAAAESAPAPTASGAAPAPAAGAPTKRRSRWGGKVDVASESARNGVAKKSRWGAKKTVTDPVQLAVQLGLPLATLQHMSAEQQQTLPQIKERMDEIDLLMQLPDCGASEIPAHQRPPSPEPIFDKAGTQVNSAGARRRQQLEAERAELVEALKPRAAQRCWRKLIVPVDKYPGYNFFGALIGPRGNAQKRMEREARVENTHAPPHSSPPILPTHSSHPFFPPILPTHSSHMCVARVFVALFHTFSTPVPRLFRAFSTLFPRLFPPTLLLPPFPPRPISPSMSSDTSSHSCLLVFSRAERM